LWKLAATLLRHYASRFCRAALRESTPLLAIIIELGWPVWPLIVASVLALALIIERTVALRRPRILPSGLLDDVVSLVRKQTVSPEVVSKLEQNSPLGRVLAAGLRNERVLREGAIQQIEAAGAIVANRLTKNLTLLGSIGSIAPLLGLFGTVVGMIHIFASQQAGSNPQELARGISVALYCTAFGIIVAVPAVLAHRYFRRLGDYLVDMEEQAERLLEPPTATGEPDALPAPVGKSRRST
jgi:biopolymer transport protein ExbB